MRLPLLSLLGALAVAALLLNGRIMQWLGVHKDALEALQAAVAALAVFVGGVWTVLHFGLKRERYPKAQLKHRLSLSPYDKETHVLRVELELENVGDTLIEVRKVTNRLQQVYPRADVEGGKFVVERKRNGDQVTWCGLWVEPSAGVVRAITCD